MRVSIILGGYGINIENIRMIARGELFIMELICDISDASVEYNILQKELKELLNKMNLGVLFQMDNDPEKCPKLIVFDIKSSLVEKNILEIINKNIDIIKCLNECIDKNKSRSTIINHTNLLKG